jgi:hypothetical protein
MQVGFSQSDRKEMVLTFLSEIPTCFHACCTDAFLGLYPRLLTVLFTRSSTVGGKLFPLSVFGSRFFSIDLDDMPFFSIAGCKRML